MPERVGFIGLGNMGGRMARRIVDGGHAGRRVRPERGRASPPPAPRPRRLAGRVSPRRRTSSCCRCPTAPSSSASCAATTACSRGRATGQVDRRPQHGGRRRRRVALAADARRARRRVPRRRHLRRRGGRREGHADDHGRAARRADARRASRPVLDAVRGDGHHMGPAAPATRRSCSTTSSTRVSLAATAEVMVAGQQGGARPAHAARGAERRQRRRTSRRCNRFPHDRRGRLPRGRPDRAT